MWLQNFLLQLPMVFMVPTRPKQYPMGVDADCSRFVLRSEWSQHGKDYVWLDIFSIPFFPFLSFRIQSLHCLSLAKLHALFEFRRSLLWQRSGVAPRSETEGVVKVAGCCPGPWNL